VPQDYKSGQFADGFVLPEEEFSESIIFGDLREIWAKFCYEALALGAILMRLIIQSGDAASVSRGEFYSSGERDTRLGKSTGLSRAT
jgi:hypothetical protein